MSKPVPVRMSEDEYARYAECAARDGIPMAKWIRNACNAYCVETEPTETPVKLTKRPDGDYQAPAKAVMPTGPISVGLASEKPPMEDIGGFKIPKDIVKSRAERLGLDKKPKGGAELFGHMLPQEE